MFHFASHAVLLSISLLAAPGGAAPEAPAQSAAEAASATELPPLDLADWSEDIPFLLFELERLHPDLYRQWSREEWLAESSRLEEMFADTSPHEAALAVARFVAMVGDGHTRASVPHVAPFETPNLPVTFYRFADGWFLTSVNPAYRSLLGQRILEVAGTPIEEAVDRLRPFAAADNAIGALGPIAAMLRNPAALHAAGILPELSDAVELRVRSPHGDESTRLIGVAATGELDGERVFADAGAGRRKPLYRQIDGPMGYRYLEAERLLYVWFSRVEDTEETTVADFFARVFAYVDRTDVERLVLDIRENPGGDGDLIQPIVHGLIQRPEITRPGSLFVIIGRGTRAAAMRLAVEIEKHTHALFVGEPTGTSPNHYGDPKSFRLPQSGITVRCSRLYWQTSDPRDRRPWITPDIPAVETSVDFELRRDPALEAILRQDALATGRDDDDGSTLARWTRDGQLAEEDWPDLIPVP